MNAPRHFIALAGFRRTLFTVVSLSALTLQLAAQSTNPIVQNLLVNGGNPQRSRITSIAFQFSKNVGANLTNVALSLLPLSNSSAISPTNFRVAYLSASNIATWTFPGLDHQALADGNYRGTLQAALIKDASGNYLDGNGDGVGGDDYVFTFHSYFGDADGDRDVDFADLFKFRQAYGKNSKSAQFNSAFDFFADGKIGTNDLAMFQAHYLTVLPMPETNGITNVIVFQAVADAGPRSGNAPLTVTFRDRGTYSVGSIIRYRWDYQDDGSWDATDVVAADHTYTFTTPGTYVAMLEVENNLGQTTNGTVTIVVGRPPPTVVANADPSNGQIPLTVNFTATASSPVGTIAKYEWDFDGNGTYDFSSPSSGNASFTYTNVKTYVAACRVTDDAGLTAVAHTITTTIRPGPIGSPTVRATANQTTGNAPLSVNFAGSATGSNAIVRWEWDFDGNGTYDYVSSNSAAVTFGYTNAGVFAATLRATDSAGLTGIDMIEIDVNLQATLSIANDTFDPTAGQTAGITTSLNASAPVRIFIKDRSGSPVRTLITQARPAGNYTDQWDGRDDAGHLLPEAAYYAILEYTVAGQTKQIDLTATTGGTRYNPSRSPLPSKFYPFNNNLLPITFTITASQGASEVLAFVGRFNVDIRFATLTDRQPFGVGTHTIYWDGLDSTGKLAVPPPGDSFLFGIWGYTLPDNAVYVQSAPTFSNVFVSPTASDPSLDAPQPITVTFDLDKPANIELTVVNLRTGLTIRTVHQPNVPAGTGQTIIWDGRTDSGLFAANGHYRLSVKAIDSSGGQSITRYALLTITY